MEEAGCVGDSIGELLRQARPDPAACAAPTLLPGGAPEQLGVDIQIVRRLGGGAMGTVYEAVHAGSTVALKALHHVTPQQLYGLKKEFRALANLSHPNVVSVYQLFGAHETWCFSMELVHGSTLSQYWRSQVSRQSETSAHSSDVSASYRASLDDTVRELLGQLIEGVAATHRAGLVHRDLKPANVLVEASGRLVIVDFGLVSDQEAGGIGQTVDRAVAGTPAYMAPEQAQGLPTSPASDWYAVGVVLYELLTGRLPLEGTLLELLSAKQDAVPVRAALVVPDIPPDLDDLCRALMHPDPARRPTSQQMLAIARSWQSEHTRSVPTSRDPPWSTLTHFVGRRELLGELERAYREAQRGGPLSMLVEGEPGIGKTALLEHFVADLQRTDGAFVLRGRCHELESLPHKGVDGVIDHLTRILLRLPAKEAMQLVPRHVQALTRLFPVLLRVACFREAAEFGKPPADSSELHRHGYEAMRELLCRIADRRSLVIVIDDLHWGDEDSLRLLSDVLAPPDAARLLLVAACRPDAAPRIAKHLEHTEGQPVRHSRLDQLTHSEARSLASALLARDERSRVLAQNIADEAEGLPLYVVELARTMSAVDTTDVGSVRELLRGSIERLASGPRQLFALIAAAGRPITRSQLARASELSDLHEPLAILRKARLVCVAGEGGDELLDAYHDRARQAGLSLLSARELRESHGRLARVLAEDGAHPEWLSELFASIGEPEAAYRHALEAARRAHDALAFHRAAELYARALSLIEHTSDRARLAALHEQHAQALVHAGRSAEAAQAYARAAQLAPSDQAIRLASSANRQWLRSGHLEQAVAGLQSVLHEVGIAWPRHPAETYVRLLLNRTRIRFSSLQVEMRPRAEVPRELLEQLDALHAAQTALGIVDYARGAYFASLALPLALRAREPNHLMSALMSESVYSAMLLGLRGRAHSEAVREKLAVVAPLVNEAVSRGIVNLSHAIGAYWEGRWSEVAAHASLAADVFASEVLDGKWEAALARSIRHSMYLHSGELVNTRSELALLGRDANARNDQYALLDVKRTLASYHLLQDQPKRAAALLAELERRLEQAPLNPMHVPMTSSLVSLHLYRGEVEAALERLERGHEKSAQLGFLRFPLVRVMLLGMRADCVVADSRMSARKRAAMLESFARSTRREPVAFAEPLSRSLLADAARLRGSSEAARHLREQAAHGFERHGMRVAASVERMRPELSEREASTHALEGREFESLGVKAADRFVRVVRSLY